MKDVYNLLLDFNTQIELLFEISEEVYKTKYYSTYSQPYDINIFDKYHAVETDTSLILSEIFKYRQQGEHIIFKEFATKYLAPFGFDPKDIINPKIRKEKWNIDISIIDKSYAIIFENKIKDANYQRNQIGKYIARLKSFGYRDEQIFIVILPLCYSHSYIEEIRKSVWKSPPDWQFPNQIRRCRHNDSYCCWCDDSTYKFSEEQKKDCHEQCIDFKNIYTPRTLVLQKSFADCLLNDLVNIIPDEQSILKSAIIQLGDFFKGLFKKRLNQQLLMEMQEYIKKKLFDNNTTNLDKWKLINEKLSQLDELKRNMENLRTSISQNLIEEWEKN